MSAGAPSVSFSNVDKVYFPAGGFTKGEMIKYYIDVAPVMLPHFVDRPVTLIRMPDGVRGERFYEKNAPGFTPDWVKTTRVTKSEGGVINYILVNDAPTLAWCANNGAVEFHPFLHRAEDLDCPTHVAFDLDPGDGADLLTCIEVAKMVRALLKKWKLTAFPKVSGSKGLQLYVPLNTPTSYAVVTPFAKALAEHLHREHPDLIVSDMAKALRHNRVFIDWSQNHAKKTTIGPYSMRGKRDEPFVSTPVTWPELERALKAGRTDDLFFSPSDVLKRVARRGDLFTEVLTMKQKLPAEVAGVALPSSRNDVPASSPLRRYAEKRNFSRTAEPEPILPTRSAQGSRRRFVIQKHAASHLHYDFRLEMDGVLKSWAVPKGVPTELQVKRSAFQVEDHPLDYFSFEGTIPAGEYGGGTVMVWDIGTYDLIGGNYWKGDLKLWLTGKKLKGEWHLFRIKSPDTKPVWLIQKAVEQAKPISPKQDDTSALSGRSMKQIAAAKDAVWSSNRGSTPAAAPEAEPETSDPTSTARGGKPRKAARRASGQDTPEYAAPAFVEPMAAREVTALPEGTDWLYEIKWDGYRGIAIKHGSKVDLRSRKDKNLATDFPEIVDALTKINATSALLDGEIVALTADGHPTFQGLQNRRRKVAAVVFYAFDLLSLDGEDLRNRPLSERKERLAEVLVGTDLKLSESFPGPADVLVEEIKKLKLEGIIAKRRDSRYESGERSGAWVKLKFSPEQEFVVGGYKRGTPLESLVVGYYDGKTLLCAGKVRQGLNPRNRRELAERFRPLQTDRCPFFNLPNSKKSHWGEGITAEQMAEIQWLKPKDVVQVSFTEWTEGGNLRHGTYRGLREDKRPTEVRRER
jgi:bifunctional non-homologous end joining protein LigD